MFDNIPVKLSHTESVELLYSLSMLLLKWGKDFRAFKIKMPLHTYYQKVASPLPTCWMLWPTIKKSYCLFFDRQKQHFHGEEICAIKIIPISQKIQKNDTTEHAFHLNLVQALPMTESMSDENLLFYVGSMQHSVAQLKKMKSTPL